MYFLFSAVFLGWALGANDSANVFGTAVASRMVKYWLAITLTAIFVVLGALIFGKEGLKTLSSLSNQSLQTAFISSLAAAITVTIMTILKLPISTSQAVVGAILGIGIMQKNINFYSLTKIIICWIGTPIGGFIFSIVIFHLLKFIFKLFKPNIFIYDSIIKVLLILAGCYGAFALGANNVANVTGVYVGNLLTPFLAVLIGGLSIALGSLTFSKKVMFTVGKSIVKLDSFTALVAVISQSITVHIYALVGVPVSTSQAIVGAVLAIGFLKGTQTINFKMLLKIISGWIFTPILGLVFSVAIYFLAHLKYIK